MKTFVHCLFLLPLALVALGCDAGSTAKKTRSAAISEADWESKVLRAAGPVLVDFGATWCGPCREMEPIVARLEKDFKVVRVDVDANADLASQMGISSIPALFIFVDGKVAKRFVGVTGESVLQNELAKLSRQ